MVVQEKKGSLTCLWGIAFLVKKAKKKKNDGVKKIAESLEKATRLKILSFWSKEKRNVGKGTGGKNGRRTRMQKLWLSRKNQHPRGLASASPRGEGGKEPAVEKPKKKKPIATAKKVSKNTEFEEKGQKICLGGDTSMHTRTA